MLVFVVFIHAVIVLGLFPAGKFVLAIEIWSFNPSKLSALRHLPTYFLKSLTVIWSARLSEAQEWFIKSSGVMSILLFLELILLFFLLDFPNLGFLKHLYLHLVCKVQLMNNDLIETKGYVSDQEITDANAEHYTWMINNK